MEKVRLPPLNAVRAFEAAARHGSFVRAAADLHVTHWAVGKQVRLLEDWLGVPLFERRSRGVVLTAEGTDFMRDVGRAFRELTAASTRLRRPGTARRVSGVVRVDVPASFALRWLMPRLARFQELYPDIEIRLSTTSRRLRLIGSAFDVAVRPGHERTRGFRTETLMADLRLPACSPELLRKYPIETVQDLRRHTLLHSTTTPTSWSHWLSTTGAPDLTPLRHMQFEHVYLQLQAAVDGLGVALASMPLIEGDIAAGRLVCPIRTPHWRAEGYELVISEDRWADPAARAFRNWIVRVATLRA
jgi:LysR family transcriptional regulator, glycine cleavage system transcriptional activator